jgi:hypothetical protein
LKSITWQSNAWLHTVVIASWPRTAWLRHPLAGLFVARAPSGALTRRESEAIMLGNLPVERFVIDASQSRCTTERDTQDSTRAPTIRATTCSIVASLVSIN